MIKPLALSIPIAPISVSIFLSVSVCLCLSVSCSFSLSSLYLHSLTLSLFSLSLYQLSRTVPYWQLPPRSRRRQNCRHEIYTRCEQSPIRSCRSDYFRSDPVVGPLTRSLRRPLSSLALPSFAFAVSTRSQ